MSKKLTRLWTRAQGLSETHLKVVTGTNECKCTEGAICALCTYVLCIAMERDERFGYEQTHPKKERDRVSRF